MSPRARKKRTVWSLAEARAALDRLIGQTADWARLDEFLIAYVVEPAHGGRPCSLRALPPASNWCAKATPKFISKTSFAPLFVRKRDRRDWKR